MPSLVRMYPRYSISSVQNVNISELPFEPSLQSGLSTSSSFLRWSSRLLLNCRGDHLSRLVHILGIPLALTFYFEKCLENLQYPSEDSCRNIFPKEDDGTDSGCIWV
jgi:hypothetical protein